MANRITEKETKVATVMASRKAGVTRAQLAAKLKITPRRAAFVLEHAGLSGERVPDGKATRTLVFKA